MYMHKPAYYVEICTIHYIYTILVGRGNSGFETADNLLGATNFVHMMGKTRLKLAWETHYVGDLRYLICFYVLPETLKVVCLRLQYSLLFSWFYYFFLVLYNVNKHL